MTFIEFNYMILQSYDFVELNQRYDCQLQMGGSDQWGNIVNGIDLGRRMGTPQLYALTTPLITTSSGAKMGKTAAGAVWLNADMLSPYEYWQYWRNTEDADVARFLKLFTTLPLDEIARLAALQGAEINEAKKVLATDATALLHGRDAADAAADTARQTFEEGAIAANLPTIEMSRARSSKRASACWRCSSRPDWSRRTARRVVRSRAAACGSTTPRSPTRRRSLTRRNLRRKASSSCRSAGRARAAPACIAAFAVRHCIPRANAVPSRHGSMVELETMMDAAPIPPRCLGCSRDLLFAVAVRPRARRKFYRLSLPVSQTFGWDRAEVVSIYSLLALCGGLAAPFVGRLFDRFGPRVAFSLGFFVLGCAFWLASFATRLWQFQVLLGVCVGFAIASIGNVPNSILIGRWFGPRLPTAMSVVYSATGAGVLIMLPLAQLLIERFGWRGAYQSSVPWRSLRCCHSAWCGGGRSRPGPRISSADQRRTELSTKAGRSAAQCATTLSGRCSAPSFSPRSACTRSPRRSWPT